MRWLLGVLLALSIGLAIYIGSAVVSLGRLIEAARAGDAASVFARIDTTRLRRSLVDQVVAAYLKEIGRDRPVKPLERIAVNTYGASVADALIAKMLTQENLTSILNEGAIASSRGVVTLPRLTEVDTSRVLETLKRISPIKPVEFLIRLGETADAGGVSIHFEGDGWKLSGIELPSAVAQALAKDLTNAKERKG
ncbi:DUF2939 domain-containing protein [Bradyrhizobium sp. HKCCYLS2038]|uniref:DUF2939 domain-containing protein n=1 Tax=unclassified Bradyrhizobium TaxID=2631580 RepID=UPI003EB7A65C